MSRFLSPIYLLPELWRTLFTQPITVRFPFAPPELPARFRGKVIIDPALCRGCGLCVRDCPAFALELERESREKFRLILYYDRCAYCGQCEMSCKFGAITLNNESVHAASQRGELLEVMVEHDDETSHEID